MSFGIERPELVTPKPGTGIPAGSVSAAAPPPQALPPQSVVAGHLAQYFCH